MPVFVALLMLSQAALADPVPVRAPRLCADDPRNSTAREIRNDDKRTVAELLGIADPDPRAHEILAARPRALSPFINWAEGIQPGMQWIKTDRIDAAGYQVCVRDTKGGYWYFRNVPGDLWQTEK